MVASTRSTPVSSVQGVDRCEAHAVPYLVRLSDELDRWLTRQSKLGLKEIIGQLLLATLAREETIDLALWRAHLNELGRAAMAADGAYAQTVADDDAWKHRDAAWRKLERAWAARDEAWELPHHWWRQKAPKGGA